MFEQEMAEKNLILKVLVGSHLYGTNTADSDKDYVGVFIPNKDYTLGLKTIEQVEIRTNPTSSGVKNKSTDTDTVLYSLPKFVKLALNNNPNIIEILYAPKKNILFTSSYGDSLLGLRNAFLSKKVKHTFCGYAYSQKMKLLHKNYVGTRLDLVKKCGYDVKFASHLIRLLTEGIQFLVEGRIDLPLPNAKTVRDIKIGKHTLDEVLGMAKKYEDQIEEAYLRTSLQRTADTDLLNSWLISTFEEFYR